MRRALLPILLFILSKSVNAQHHRFSDNGISGKKSHHRRAQYQYEIAFQCGLTQFFGELNDQDMKGMLGVELSRAFDKQWKMQMAYSAGKIGGEKQTFFDSYFICEYNAIELTAKWDLTEQFSHFEPGPVHFCLEAGVGQIFFSSNAFDLESNTLKRFTNSQLSARNPLFLRWGKPSGPTGIRKTREGILPLGLSLEYKLFQKVCLGLEYKFYFVRTDKLDATSGFRLINPEESDSYSDTPQDKFSILSVRMAYRFGKTNRSNVVQK